jgi:hypothetical protein
MHDCLQGVDLVAFRSFLKQVDGHDLWLRQKFIEMGFSQAVVNRSTRDHVSDDDPATHLIDEDRLRAAIDKGEITEGQADLVRMMPTKRFTKEHLVAVDEIDFLRDLANDLGTPTSPFVGRGSFARGVANGILEYLDRFADDEANPL